MLFILAALETDELRMAEQGGRTWRRLALWEEGHTKAKHLC